MIVLNKTTHIQCLFFLLLFNLFQPQPASCHESLPGVVEMHELGESRYKIVWKAPIYYFKPHPAKLELPGDWETVGTPTSRRRTNDIVHEQIVTTGSTSIDGKIIRFPGLESTITDIFIRVTRADGSQISTIARPTRPWAVLRGERKWYVTAREYLTLGFHHILRGVDHLLFILGLLFIVKNRTLLVKTVTSFTVAHSITLGLATLGYAQAPLLPLNAAIALSILFLGPEIIRAEEGETSLTIRYPWIIAFGFGLLHGFGFASGLSTTGMVRSELAPALLFFNIGVELGQLGFVVLILAVGHSLERIEFRWPKWAWRVPGYTVGSLGAFWTIQRIAMMGN